MLFLSKLLVAVLAMTFLFLSGCNTAKARRLKRARNALNRIIYQANQLHADRDGIHLDDYRKLADRLKMLLNEHPELQNDEEAKEDALQYYQKFKGFSMRAEITEPDEKIYSFTGYASPLLLVTEKRQSQDEGVASPSNRTPVYYVGLESKSSIRFKSGRDFVVFPVKEKKTVTTNTFRVSRASLFRSDNKIDIVAFYEAYLLLRMMAKGFDLNRGFEITMKPEVYTLKKAPKYQNRAYERMARRSKKPKFSTSTSKNRDLVANSKIAGNGQFTIGSLHKGKDFDLLYGHPNSVSPNGIWSSYVSVKVDDSVYKLHEQTNMQVVKLSNGTLETTVTLDEEKVQVVQRLIPWSRDGKAYFRIEFETINKGRASRQIGVRLMLDTWAGRNDGVPFLLPQGENTEMLQYEAMFTPSDCPIWQTFDIPLEMIKGNPVVFMRNFMIGENLVPPDRVAFANWPDAYRSRWDYVINPRKKVTGDSAVVIWWEPQRVSRGKSRNVATRFGITTQKNEPYLLASNPKKGLMLIFLVYKNKGTEAVDLRYKVRAENAALSTMSYGDLEAKIPAGGSYVNLLVATAVAASESSLEIVQHENDKQKTFSFPIETKLPDRGLSTMPASEPGKKLPVVFFLKGRRSGIMARLVDTDGVAHSRIRLKPERWKNGYLYKGDLPVPANVSGRYYVEVYR